MLSVMLHLLLVRGLIAYRKGDDGLELVSQTPELPRE
jgi:hypothetical protein